MAILGTALNLQVGFVTAGIPGPVTVSAAGQLVLKEAGKHTADPLVMDAAWEASGSGVTARYLFSALVSGEDLQTAIAGKEQLSAMAQIEWTPDGEEAPRRSWPFALSILNSYIQPGDSPGPVPVIGSTVPYYRTITALTGGTASDMDSIPTAALPVRTLIQVVIGLQLMTWILQAGTDAPDGEGIVRGTDYASPANEKFWFRIA